MIGEILVLGILGLAFGAGLTLASRKFAVHVDERIEKIGELLPGTNCGACGFAGCADLASALVEDTSLIDKCAQVTPEAKRGIGGVLGIEVKIETPKVAKVACVWGSKVAFEYRGAKSCGAAVDLMDGFLACKEGCLGLGDCVEVCPFDAIAFEDGKIRIDSQKCTGCGVCITLCPRNVIALVPRDTKVFVACNSPKPAKEVVAVCTKGCIVCKLCEKACEQHAIKIEDNLPVIDQSRCNGCGACIESCKRGVLEPLHQAPSAS
jgi:RnfABCDGE-type electron transport complex B subunit